jgi:hypothetical protein
VAGQAASRTATALGNSARLISSRALGNEQVGAHAQQ